MLSPKLEARAVKENADTKRDTYIIEQKAREIRKIIEKLSREKADEDKILKETYYLLSDIWHIVDTHMNESEDITRI